MVYKLYVSGICYGMIEKIGKNAKISQLDIETEEFQEYKEISDDCDKISSFNLIELIKMIGEKEEAVKGLPEKFKLKGGAEYEKVDETLYIQRNKKHPCNIILKDGEIIGFISPKREAISVLIKEGYEKHTILDKWKENHGNEKLYGVKFLGEYMVEMRDGISLATDVYIPNDESIGEIPSIFIRTPYNKEIGKENYYKYVQRGYGVIIQNVRGRNNSTGDWRPMYYETEDGDDSLTWIGKQGFSNGKVGMIGGSYLGYVQWAALASGNPNLACIVSIVTAGSAFIDMPRRGGCLSSGTMAWSFMMSNRDSDAKLMDRKDWEELLDIRPLEEISVKGLGKELPFFNEQISHENEDEYWEKGNWVLRSKGKKVPALIMSGWFDDNGMGTTEAIDLVKDFPGNMKKIILGPWQHGGNSTYDLHALSFGADAIKMDIDLYFIDWFDKFLKGKENGINDGENVEYYTVGEEKWKKANSWPIPNGKEITLYLGGEDANTSRGKGILSYEETEDGENTYKYDPENPATHIIDMSENEISVPEDYTEEEERNDYLCYSTEALKEDVIITGDIECKIYISSNARDTDFMVRILDVDENGKSIKLADGIIDAKYREGFHEPVYMEEGEVYPITIRTTKISNMFKSGHKIRFTVTSSAKNFVFPNSNTIDGFNSKVNKIADNKVHHGKKYKSCIKVTVEGE